MLDAFADGVDAGVAGAHVVVDDDAAIDVQAGGAARSMFGRMPTAITTRSAGISRPSASTTPSARSVAEDFLGLAVGEERDAALVEIAAQQLAGGGVELALHQRRHQVHDRDRHAAPLQALGRFEPQQPAADHHRARCASPRPRSSPRHRRCRGRRGRRASPSPGIGGASGFEPVASSSLS